MEIKKNKIWLSSPTMHGDEEKFVKKAFESNWVSTIGENIDELEKGVASYLGDGLYAVGLSSGTAALHLAYKLSGIERGDIVFCSDLTFAATANPLIYEGAIPVFIDSEYETWNMDLMALRKAFEKYPKVKAVVVADLYGVTGRLDEIKELCKKNNVILIEDAAESFGASYKDKKAGSFGDFNIISFNGNKIITTSGGGMLISEDKASINKAKFMSTQAREPYPWYEHREVGYNYRLSNILAGIGRGQLIHLEEHIQKKREIYELYKEGLKNLPVSMNPFIETSKPNYWLSCMIIDETAMAIQDRSRFIPVKMDGGTNTFAERKEFERGVLSRIEAIKKEKYSKEDFFGKLYKKESGKSSPEEIRDRLGEINAESRPIWKPMHLQPYFSEYDFITAKGGLSEIDISYIPVSSDIYERGLCLPSDIKMTKEEQKMIIEVIKDCFKM